MNCLKKNSASRKNIKNLILLFFLFLFLNSCVYTITKENVGGYSTNALCDFINPWLYITTSQEKQIINGELSRRSVAKCGSGNQAREFSRSSFAEFYFNATQSGFTYFAIVASDTRWEAGASSASFQEAIDMAFKQCISNDCVLVHTGPPNLNTLIYDNSYLSRKMKENEERQQAKIESENRIKELQEKRQKEADEQSRKIEEAEKKIKDRIEKDKEYKKAENKPIEKAETQERSSSPQISKHKKENYISSAGTGFFINDSGQFISNNHVIGMCDSIRARIDGIIYEATLISNDVVNDLAVGKINLLNQNFIALASSISLAEDILVFGFPLWPDLGDSIKATKGIVSSLSGAKNNSSEIQFDAAAQKGNSGGPIVNDKSELIGVTVRTQSLLKRAFEEGTIPQNINYGVKVQTLKTFLDANGIKYFSSKNKRKLQNKQIAKRISNSTFLVACIRSEEQTFDNQRLNTSRIILDSSIFNTKN